VVTRFFARAVCVMVLTFGLVWMPAAESAAALGCTNIPGSAIDQYCEVVPTVTGGRVPDGHGQPVGATLPGPQRRRLLATAAGQRLARLPASNRISRKVVSIRSEGGRQPPTTSATGGQSTRSAAGVSALSLSLPLIVVLVVSAVGLIGSAAVGRSRRRSRS
jgi:hypothetical protein